MTNNPQPEIRLINQSGLDVPIDDGIVKNVANAVAAGESVSFRYVEVVYVDEEAIVQLNNTWLGKSYVTDIITFPYTSPGSPDDIEVTLACCAQRIAEQATEFGTDEKEEYARVIIHGLLHLSGYNDNDSQQAGLMKSRENYYLDLLNLDS